MTADGQEPGVRGLAVELGGDGQDGLGSEGVAHSRHGARGLDYGECERPTQAAGGVDEDDDVVPGAGQGVLDVELVVGVAGDTRETAGLQAFRGRGAQAVIPAAGVADPEDERGPGLRFSRNQRTFLWRTWPRASTSETSSGICPTAWVAQLRHGS